MQSVGFWCPLKSESCSIFNLTEELFSFGDRQVIYLSDGSSVGLEKGRQNSCMGIACKIVLYLTVIIPVVAFLIKVVHRVCRQITIDPKQVGRDKAATTIQKHVRGYLTRKAHLPSGLYPQYHLATKSTVGMPRAKGGNTEVYVPQQLSGVVLKKSGRKNAIERFHQMQKVRAVLKSQNSSHLIIPRANLCENFLVEDRLPIDTDSYHNMGLYHSNPNLFDAPVDELVLLFSKMYLTDLVSRQKMIPLSHIESVEDYVRYDNLPLYIVEKNEVKEGRIGLIDLEHIEESPSPQGLETLVRIFPYHLDRIKEQARKLGMEVNEALLDVAASKGKKYLEVGYITHIEWLKGRNVPLSRSLQPFEITPEREKVLIEKLKGALLKLNTGENDVFHKKYYMGSPPKDFLIGDSEQIAQNLAKDLYSQMKESLKNAIENKQKEHLNQLEGQNMTESQLVSLRSPYLKRQDVCNRGGSVHGGIASWIEKNPNVRFSITMEGMPILENLFEVLMQELVNGGEIFHFDPAYYTQAYDFCWVRY